MAQLQEALTARRRAALSGLGGVGKTQTAVEYAHQHLKEYDYIFWVSAASREGLLSGYATIAGLLKLGEYDAKDQTVAVEAVKRWLTSRSGWLLILDNADDLAMAREFISSGKNGHVLLTTRALAAGAVAQRVEVQKMKTDEATLFLLRRAKYIAENAPFDAAAEVDRTRAEEIVTQLDGLPLALDQAGAYIEETGCGLSGYLDLYRRHAPDLLRLRGALTFDHPPVATTWVLSFENIEKANPAAAELLRFCAFLYPDGIPEEVFNEGAKELGPVLGPAGSDAFRLNGAIAEILKYSLLRRDPEAKILEIHRLVQAVLRQSMEEATQRLWAERAVRAVNRAFPTVKFSTWILCERFLSQAHACLELIHKWNLEFPEAARLLNEAGFYLSERGRYIDSEPLFGQALAIRERALGSEHPDVAWSVNKLAMLYRIQGQYARAELLYERALAVREKVMGPEHPDVAQSLIGLAELRRVLGQHAEAEALFKRGLAIREKALGSEHPDVALSLNKLAEFYNDQGRYAEVEPLYKRALAIREKVSGMEHPDVAWSLNGLARLYTELGRYAEAEALCHRALAIREKTLGPEHLEVARSLNTMSEIYRAQGQYAKAEPGYKRALMIWEKVLGSEHRAVATCLENYALCLRAMDRSREAEPLEAQARAIRDKLKLSA